MKVVITRNGEDDLEAIYRSHAEYSIDYADKFFDQIVGYIIERLSQFPLSAPEYSPETGIRRLVYDEKINIYYVLKDDAAYVLYILDARRILNEKILMLSDEDVIGIVE